MKLSTLGMMEAADATKALISASKGWKLTAEEVSQVTNELTALDMAAATSAGDLATAMAKANATASLAGADRQSYEAYLTTVLDVSQQSPETAGTAFKTLFARYSNIKSGKYSSSYDSTDDTGEFEALNDVETVLRKSGIKIRNSVSEFRDITEVFEEIASKWSSMNDVDRNAIANALGGTRQREQVSILFENWDKVKEYKKVAEESEGTADIKMLSYTSGIEASQNRLTAAVEKFVSGNGYENILSGIYDMLTMIVKSVGKIATIGGLYMLLKADWPRLVQGFNNFGNSINRFVSQPANNIRGLISNISENR
jgi:TP901 family phage tail tape measure protein